MAEVQQGGDNTGGPVLAVVAIAIVWGALRFVFWTGCVGSDDLLYIFYAHELDHLPAEFWEFRMGTVLLTHLMLGTLGPSEWAVCLPTLAASLAILVSVACFVDWPRVRNWQTSGAVLLAAVMPIDVTMASYPVPTVVAAGWLAIGTVFLLKGEGRLPYLGALLLALGFWTHEIYVFYVGLLCLACLAVDRRRHWRPVLICVCLAAGIVAVEAAVYAALLGDPLARWHAAAGEAQGTPGFGGSALAFFLWPLRIAVFSKQFGFDLLLSFVTGAFAWRHLDRSQRVLLLTVFAYWLWLGYGTQVPWAYRPRGRDFHYYVCLTFPIAALLPTTLRLALETRRRMAAGILVAAIGLHVASLAAGGRWGASVEESRRLLAYAASRPQTRFLTDWGTLREMYFANGMRQPANVAMLAPLDWLGVREDKNQSATAAAADALMVNHERSSYRVEDGFPRLVDENTGRSIWRSPVRYKPLVLPIARLVGREELALSSLGSEVFELENR